MAFIDISGDRYGKLLAIRPDHINKHGQSAWLCVCDCGKQHVALSQHLRSGRTRSCGNHRKQKEKA